MKYEVHPLAASVPRMGNDEYEAFVAAVKDRGCINRPGHLYEGMILDGRHRAAAAEFLGIEMVWHTFKGTPEEAQLFVMDENIHRRQLTQAQRVEYARDYLRKAPELSDKQIAKRTRTGKATVRKLREASNVPTSGEAKQAKIAKVVAENPDASDREVAKKADVSHHTVAKARKGGQNGPVGPKCPPPKPPARPVKASPSAEKLIAAALVFADEIDAVCDRFEAALGKMTGEVLGDNDDPRRAIIQKPMEGTFTRVKDLGMRATRRHPSMILKFR